MSDDIKGYHNEVYASISYGVIRGVLACLVIVTIYRRSFALFPANFFIR